MKTLILLSLLVITLNHVNGFFECTRATGSCASKSKLTAKTCNEKFPFFKCLRDKGCTRDDSVYKAQVKVYSYEGCGASAIIMGWTLPILMLTAAKYFSMH